MAGFKAILGHEQIIEHLQNAVTMDKVSHAYIINGPDKSGKMMLAEAFAQTLECEKLEDVVKMPRSRPTWSRVWNVIPVSRR